MPLIWTTSGSTHEHREQQPDHSGVHNLSQKHTPDASSFEATQDRAKQHPISYLVCQQ
jgi:hypothetical protein